MNEALVEHAEHDVDRYDRGEHEKGLVAQCRLERLSRSLEARLEAPRQAHIFLRSPDRIDRRAEGSVRGQIEGDGSRRKLPEMADLERGPNLRNLGDDAQRDLTRARRRRRQVERLERGKVAVQGRIGFQDDAILARLREYRGDDALAESVIERVVDCRQGDPEAPGGGAVDRDHRRKALVLQVARHVRKIGQRAQPFDQPRDETGKLREVRGLQHELILRGARGGVDGEVLDRLHMQRDAGNGRRFLLQPADDLARRTGARVARAQIDEEAAGIQCRIVGPVDADERGQADDIRILQDDVRQRPLAFGHGLEGDGLIGLGDALDQAGILHREETFRHHDIEQDRDADGRGSDHERGALVVEHTLQRPTIGGDCTLETGLGGAREPTACLFGAMVQQPCAHHRNESQRDDRRDHDGGGKGDRKLVEQPPDHIAHEQEGNEHRKQGDGERDDGETDFRRAVERRLQRRFAHLAMTRDVLDHHDGIVDHEAGRDRQRHQREIVETELPEIHDRQAADERQRYRERGNEGRRQVSQKEEDHQHYQRHREQQLELDVRDRSCLLYTSRCV